MYSNKCNLPLNPVTTRESGEGLPYAPMDFPLSGDIWAWKVGHRILGDGFMQDRYLYPPKRFKMSDKRLKSKKAVKDFIRRECPNTDLDDFWSSFHWRIPAKDWVKGEVFHLGNSGHDDPILFKSDNLSSEGLPYAPNFPKMVSAGESGEGLPYAPMDFPLPGDIWAWKVGHRITIDGFVRDRYLYPPKRFKMSYKRLESRKAVKDFIKREYPNTDLDNFWSSFLWRIPAKDWVKGEGLPYAPKFPKPVSAGESGEGLPYAPMDFPLPGDIWVWKVGQRITDDGFMQDRYLDPPKRFKMRRFGSKIAVEAFITTECPNTNLDDFWSSFHWRIPARDRKWGKGEISLGNNGHLRDDPISSEFDHESGEGLPYAPMNFPKPVSTGESGEGLPYAPVDFPKHGDIWAWKVGQRITSDGFMRDRYLYPPKRFKMSFKRLQSKNAVENFITTECPNTQLDDFWTSFHWMIPAKDCSWKKVSQISLGNNGQLRDDPILFESDNESDDILLGSKQDEAKTSPDHMDLVLPKLQNGNCLDQIRNAEEDISAHCAVREGREKENPLKRWRREEMEKKNVEKAIQKIIKRFPDGATVAGDDDCHSSCLAFETTPLNKRVIKTGDLVSVAITFDMVKNEKHKSREWFTVEEGGNRTWISYAEVDGLNPRKWVTGNIIDWYGTKLREMLKRRIAGGHHQQFIICNNFFFTILAADYKKHMEKLEDEEDYRDMDFQNQTAVFASKLNRNWTSQIPADDVQSSILIPINYRNSHWALFVVHPLKSTIDLYDPLYNDLEALKNYDEEMNALITMLSMYYVHKDPTSNIEWVKKVCSDLPKQPNNYDCGVFVIAYMDCICREVEIEFDEQKGSEYFRYIFARDLLEDGGKLTERN